MSSKLKNALRTYVTFHLAHLPAQLITFHFVSKMGSWVEMNPIMSKVFEISPFFVFVVPIPVLVFLSLLANSFDKYRKIVVTATLVMLLTDSGHDLVVFVIYLLQKNM